MTDDTHGIGDNFPPVDLPSGEVLRSTLVELNADLARRRDELLEAAERVPPITSEEIARDVGDYIKQLTAAMKAAESIRVQHKEPYLAAGSIVDGYFKGISEPLAKVKASIESRLTGYLRSKAERERREREEQRRQYEAAERQRRAEAEAAAQRVKDQDTLTQALEAERRAQEAAADADKAAKLANAGPAEMSRTRGDFGSVSSLRRYWTFSDLDREGLDLETLRPYLAIAALESAVRQFIKAGGRDLAGVEIYETTDAVVR